MAKEQRRWTQKEDDILKIAVGKDVERVDWLSIAEHLPGRNNKECRKRWHQKFATNTNNHGSWTEQEDQRLRMAVTQHGTKWALVAQAVRTRSSEQCSKRWNDVLNPGLNRSPWTDEDDNLLISNVDTHGRNWKMIAQLHFQDRSALSLKNRHALLLRRQARGSQNQRDVLQNPEANSGIGLGSRQGALSRPSDSPQSSQRDSRDAADELGSMPENENDVQNFLPRIHGTETAVASPESLGDSFMPFGQSSSMPIDMSAHENDALTSEISQLIHNQPFLLGQELQQSHQQQPAYPDMSSSLNPLQTGIDFSIHPTSRSIAPNPKVSSDDSESWEDFLCLGISCPRKGLEAFKMAVLEAVTKGPGCQGDGDDEKVQIMLKVRRRN